MALSWSSDSTAYWLNFDRRSEERGRALKMRIWRIAQAIPLKYFRHLLFSYTSLAERFDEPQCVADRALRDREIPLTELSPIYHSGPAPKKAWWRAW
jgi:hypothetical protein